LTEQTTFPGSSDFKNLVGADLAVLNLDEKMYLVSILETCNTLEQDHIEVPFKNRVSLVDITDGAAKVPPIILEDDGALPEPLDHPPPGQQKGCQTWGSSWNLEVEQVKQILFAPDSGQGIFQLIPGSIDLQQKTVSFKEHSKQIEAVEWNNGFTCIESELEKVNYNSL